jgi:hypothetical protein
MKFSLACGDDVIDRLKLVNKTSVVKKISQNLHG